MKTFVITKDHVMMNTVVADALSQCQVHLYVQFVTILWFTKQTAEEDSFYGCSKYPGCNGYRGPQRQNPGPTALILQLRNRYGSKWDALEAMKIEGKIPSRQDLI